MRKKAGWGRQKGLDGNPSHKADGLGFYLDADYNYGPGNVTLGVWWINGTQYDADKHHNLVGMGDFSPFIVAYHSPTLATNRWGTSIFDLAASVGNQQYFTVVSSGPSNNTEIQVGSNPGTQADDGATIVDIVGFSSEPVNPRVQRLGTTHNSYDNLGAGNNNHWALALSGNQAFTDEISIHYGLGYFRLVKPNFRMADSVVGRTIDGAADFAAVQATAFKDQSKDLGWEIDLGVNVKLLENLTFDSTFGYFVTGQAFDQPDGWIL